MALTLTHRDGRMNTNVDDRDVDSLLAELDGPDDAEHPDVLIAHESGWALSAFPNGIVVGENLESEGPVGHSAPLGREDVRHLFRLVARNELEAVEAFAWAPGYGS